MAPCVYKNDLLTVARFVRHTLGLRNSDGTEGLDREQAGETKDLETDPTLQRSNIQCPVCFKNGYVGFDGIRFHMAE